MFSRIVGEKWMSELDKVSRLVLPAVIESIWHSTGRGWEGLYTNGAIQNMKFGCSFTFTLKHRIGKGR